MLHGPPVVVHDEDNCVGERCCIHDPSPHPLRNAPLVWKKPSMLRRCEHEVDHPDPDDLVWRFGSVAFGRRRLRHVCACWCCGLPRHGETVAVAA